MEFTYNSYGELLKLLYEQDYYVTNYHDWKTKEQCVILRHDIDYDINKALEMACFEQSVGCRSTFFVLITSDFYNVFSSHSRKLLHGLQECGHDIGLHFDEASYPGATVEEICDKIVWEKTVLEQILGEPVTTFSMHRPSRMILRANLMIPGMINSYGNEFFKGFKFVSDSRHRWREPVIDIIKSKQYARLHILTHAFWYENIKLSIHDSLKRFVNRANYDRYSFIEENITDLNSIMHENEVLHE